MDKSSQPRTAETKATVDRDPYVSILKTKIKRLRKKLREIEYLRHTARPLNSDEEAKIAKATDFRQELQEALTCLPQSPKAGQDTIPTAQLISDVIEEEPENGPTEDSNVFKEEPVQTTLSEDSDSQEVEPTNGDSAKRQLDKCDTEENGQPTLDRASPRPSSPKRIKKERSLAKELTTKSKKSIKNQKEETDNLQHLEKIWRSSEFTVNTLEGHNDVISAVAVDGNIIVSSSRDTTVKVWNAETCQEVFSLRGHKGSVSCLALLNEEASNELGRYSGFGSSHRLVISGAADCTIILWSVTSGEKKKSIYTFNTVTCVAYIQPDVCFITATDSGKLEIYDAVSGSNIRSLTAYDDGYSCVVSNDNFVFTAATDGIIKVWEVVDRNLSCVFTMDDLTLAEGQEITLRDVCALAVHGDWVYYGDDGPNLKCFNWRTKVVAKFVNQMCDCGTTDSVVCMQQEVIASSYNVDTANGHINIRLHPSGHYLCSLEDNTTGRICCMAATTTNGTVRIVTGGAELKVWDVLQPPFSGRRGHQNQQKKRTYLKPQYIPFYTREAQQSDYESSNDSSEEGSQDEGRFERYYIPQEINSQPTLWRYCSIL